MNYILNKYSNRLEPINKVSYIQTGISKGCQVELKIGISQCKFTPFPYFNSLTEAEATINSAIRPLSEWKESNPELFI